MVRLRPTLTTSYVQQLKIISIPLWCDCDAILRSLLTVLASRISIPLWCDCDSFGQLLLSAETLFQSHYGAIATQCHCSREVASCCISIPLWCDCDMLSPSPLLPSAKLLSIPLWCDCDCAEMDSDGTGNELSIPLWCDCDDAM